MTAFGAELKRVIWRTDFRSPLEIDRPSRCEQRDAKRAAVFRLIVNLKRVDGRYLSNLPSVRQGQR